MRIGCQVQKVFPNTRLPRRMEGLALLLFERLGVVLVPLRNVLVHGSSGGEHTWIRARTTRMKGCPGRLGK